MMDPGVASLRTWTLFALLLGLSVNVSESFGSYATLELVPGFFLPILTAWIAHIHKTRVASLLAALAVPTVTSAGLQLTSSVNLSYGFWIDSYLVAVGAAVVFACPSKAGQVARAIRPWWPQALWAALVLLAVVVVSDYQRVTIASSDSVTMRLNVGVAIVFVTAGVLVRWREAIAMLREGAQGPLLQIAAVALIIATVLSVSVGSGYVGVGTGDVAAGSLLMALCFLAAACGLLDWRGVALLLAAAVAAENLWFRTRMAEPEPYLRTTLVPMIAAVLVGAAVSPFWKSAGTDTLKSPRSTALFLALVALQTWMLPSTHDQHLITGGIAFIGGLKWGFRGLVATPAALLLAHALLKVTNAERLDLYLPAWIPLELTMVGGIAFPFAFFGLLSNRFGRAHSETHDESIIDITQLARVVRWLDESSTLKSFAAVVSILFVALNVTAIFGAIFALTGGEKHRIALVAALLGTAAVVSFAPLAFIAVDWVARKPWRHVPAIAGAGVGAVASAIVGAALGVACSAFSAMARDVLRDDPALSAAVLPGSLLLLLLAWLTITNPRIRRLASTVFGTIAALAVTALVLHASLSSGEEAGTIVGYLAIAMATCALLVWLVGRAVLIGAVLSGDRPRGILLGDLSRSGFWVRFAFVSGLPSSLWHAGALRRLHFWAFVAARPLVYFGAAALGATFLVAFEMRSQLTVGVLLVALGHVAFWGAKRLAARDSWSPDAPSIDRPPILFLRSFGDDQVEFSLPFFRVVRRWFQLWSFRRNADEALIDEAAQYGPVVALGRPGEHARPFGALRHYADHQDWEETIAETARRARAIVIAAGSTAGVLLEYRLLARERLLRKTLVLFPPNPQSASGNEKALEAFAEATSVGRGLRCPEGECMVALLATDADPVLLTARTASGAACVAAIRAHLQAAKVTHLDDPLGGVCDPHHPQSERRPTVRGRVRRRRAPRGDAG